VKTRPSRIRLTPALTLAAMFASAAPGAAGYDPSRIFRDMFDAETVSQRADLCSQIPEGESPQYLLSFCQGLLALANRSDSLAVLLLEEALKLQPDFAAGCVIYADGYVERGDTRNAIRWYRRASAIAPKRLDPYYGIGRIWLERAETEGTQAYAEALQAFRQMTVADPSNPDGWSNVGMVLASMGRFDEAEESFKKALSLAPRDPALYESLGALASRRGDDAAAEDAWRQSLKVDPANATAAIELASLFGRQGRISEAAAVLEHGVATAQLGQAAGRLRRDLALLSLLEDRTKRAASLLEEAWALSPDARTLAALAHVHLLNDKVGDALPLLAEAAGKDSVATGPFVRAWQMKIAPELPEFGQSNPAGSFLLRKLGSRPLAPSEPAGAYATHHLVRLLLPDWALPDGKLTIERRAAQAEYDTPPVPVFRATATYPETAVGSEGTVQIRVKIDKDGGVRDARVIEGGGNPALEWAALDAAKRWRFQPALRNGKPVESEVTIPFRFSIAR